MPFLRPYLTHFLSVFIISRCFCVPTPFIIVLTSPQEETTLPMAGKRRKLSGKILIDYFGQERLGLNRHVVDSVLEDINKPIRGWKDLLKIIETIISCQEG